MKSNNWLMCDIWIQDSFISLLEYGWFKFQNRVCTSAKCLYTSISIQSKLRTRDDQANELDSLKCSANKYYLLNSHCSICVYTLNMFSWLNKYRIHHCSIVFFVYRPHTKCCDGLSIRISCLLWIGHSIIWTIECDPKFHLWHFFPFRKNVEVVFFNFWVILWSTWFAQYITINVENTWFRLVDSWKLKPYKIFKHNFSDTHSYNIWMETLILCNREFKWNNLGLVQAKWDSFFQQLWSHTQKNGNRFRTYSVRVSNC